MKPLGVSGAVRPLYGSLGVKGLNIISVSATLVIQRAMRMGRTVLPSVACPAVHFIPHYLIHGDDFPGGKKNIDTNSVSTFSTTFMCNISYFKNRGRCCYKYILVRMQRTGYKYDVWLTVHRNSVWIRKTN